MTTPVSPVDPAAVLREAAAKVRAVGEAARARGPFSVAGRCLCDEYPQDEDRCTEQGHRHSSWQVRTEVPHDPTWISYQVVETNCEEDACWLALLSPAAAEPLAACGWNGLLLVAISSSKRPR